MRRAYTAVLSIGFICATTAAFAEDVFSYPGPAVSSFTVCQAPQIDHYNRRGRLIQGPTKNIQTGGGSWTITHNSPVYLATSHRVQNTYDYLVPGGSACIGGDPVNVNR